MRTDWSHLEKWRYDQRLVGQREPSRRGDLFGVFEVPFGQSRFILTRLFCIATSSRGLGIYDEAEPNQRWEHVSVSARILDTLAGMPKEKQRLPTWAEMCHVKDLFWKPEEAVVQFHPARADYVNEHQHCLHLWRPEFVELPAPDPILVGMPFFMTK